MKQMRPICRRSLVIVFAAVLMAQTMVSAPAWPQTSSQKPQKSNTDPAAGQGVREPPPPPYETRLLRLSEIMGALAYLQDLCGMPQSEEWRKTMQGLLDAEAKTPKQRARLAGAFNAGFRGYEWSYHTCTDNARLVVERHLLEGEKIARDVANRYGGG